MKMGTKTFILVMYVCYCIVMWLLLFNFAAVKHMISRKLHVMNEKNQYLCFPKAS